MCIKIVEMIVYYVNKILFIYYVGGILGIYLLNLTDIFVFPKKKYSVESAFIG